MERQGDEVHIETDEARGASTPHIVRYVLIISLLLAVGALSLIWMIGAANSDQPQDHNRVSGQKTPAPQ